VKPDLEPVPLETSCQLDREKKEVADRFSANVEAYEFTQDGLKYGYVRVRAFDFDVEFPSRFKKLLETLPQGGLIIDLRENPGGHIKNAESILQLLTANIVRPTGFRLIATEGTKRLTESSAGVDAVTFHPWHQSLSSPKDGYSAALPYSTEADMTALGQRYYGPCVLIVDALTFSAAEMFAAGFKDNNIGKVIGAGSSNTGGAAALVLKLNDLQTQVKDQKTELPTGAEFVFPVLQCVRINPKLEGVFGDTFEEVGIEVDEVHELTRNDVLNSGTDLLKRAVEVLRTEPSDWPSLQVTQSKTGVLSVTSKNVKSIKLEKFELNARGAKFSSDEVENPAQFTIPLDSTYLTRVTIEAVGTLGRKAFWKEQFPASDSELQKEVAASNRASAIIKLRIQLNEVESSSAPDQEKVKELKEEIAKLEQEFAQAAA
jgi:hypothetical protein